MSFKYFSERNNYKKLDEVLQIESINDALKNILWSYIRVELDYMSENNGGYGFLESFLIDLHEFLWKLPIDDIPYDNYDRIYKIRYKYFEYSWFEIYDFIEFMVSYLNNQSIEYDFMNDRKNIFIQNINNVLERENSGYRLIEGYITPITDKIEIECLDETFEKSSIENVKTHFDNALSLLSDRKNPDFRNSIKESISAVECICRKITTESTLDRALPKLENKGVKIPDVLKIGIEKMYHWTNGGDGIRHALMDDTENTSFAEAKYMLIVCSAFVNYIISKMS